MLLTITIPLALFSAAIAVPETEIERIPITVRETAGLRRFGFPVTAAVPFPRGALRDVDHIRLIDDRGKEVPTEVTARAHWAQDGGVQWIEVDFNANPGPHEVEQYILEVGPGIERARPTRGVTLTETAEEHQAGGYRVPKSGQPLLTSVRYGELDYLRPQGAQLTIVDRSGATRGVRPGSVRTRALKAEPILVMLEQRGEYEGGGHPLAFRTTMAFPNSKSWIHLVHEIEDADGEAQEIRLRMPFALETAPRLFDFGTGSWLYGVLRPDQAATLTQRTDVARRGAVTEWKVTLGSDATAPPYAAGDPAGPVRAEGWAHLMDGRKVIALGVAHFADAPGEHSIRLGYDGDCLIRWRPDRGGRTTGRATGELPRRSGGAKAPLRLEAYFHFIPFPAQLTAATSPPSMLAPLDARCAPERYRTAGVPPPRFHE